MEERDKLLGEIAALEERENYYQQQVDTATDTATAEAFAAELAATQAKIAAKKEQLEQLTNAASDAQGAIFNKFDNIGVGSLRDMCIDEGAYQLLSAWIQQEFGDQAQQNAVVVASYQSQVEKLKEEMDDVIGTNDNLQEEIKTLESKVVYLNEQVEDISAKRDAAVKSAEEAHEETKRLAADNESLRKQLETAGKPLQTNVNTDLTKAKEDYLKSRPAVYDVEEQQNGNRTAKLLETDEVVVWEKIYPGKYRIASAEEVQRFRQEAAATVEVPASVEEEHIPDNALAVEPPPAIPSESENAGVPADSTVGQVVQDDTAVTRQEFRALEKRIAYLEDRMSPASNKAGAA